MCQRQDCACEYYEQRRDRHHLTPKAVGGTNGPVVRLWRAKHNAWHRLFDLMDLQEIIYLLESRCRNTYWIVKRQFSHHVGDDDWQILFGDKELDQAIALLRRLQRIKYAT